MGTLASKRRPCQPAQSLFFSAACQTRPAAESSERARSTALASRISLIRHNARVSTFSDPKQGLCSKQCWQVSDYVSLLILGSRTEQLRASQSVSSAAERLRVRSQVQSACDQVRCLVPSNVHIEMRCGIVFVNQPYSFWFRSSMRNAALSWLHSIAPFVAARARTGGK